MHAHVWSVVIGPLQGLQTPDLIRPASYASVSLAGWSKCQTSQKDQKPSDSLSFDSKCVNQLGQFGFKFLSRRVS